MTAEIRRRAGELLSLLSCLLNVLIGTDDREVTLSAGSWELRQRGSHWGHVLVVIIDYGHIALTAKGGHCRRAWEEHGPVRTKVAADQA